MFDITNEHTISLVASQYTTKKPDNLDNGMCQFLVYICASTRLQKAAVYLLLCRQGENNAKPCFQEYAFRDEEILSKCLLEYGCRLKSHDHPMSLFNTDEECVQLYA